MLDTKDPAKIIETVLTISPGFGGVNLEDISQPKCFRILDTLQARAEIPIWHDDQQGSALVVLAGLINALKVVGKKLSEVSHHVYRRGRSRDCHHSIALRVRRGSRRCRVVDVNGLLYKGRADIELRKAEYIDMWRLCQITNVEGRQGASPKR